MAYPVSSIVPGNNPVVRGEVLHQVFPVGVNADDSVAEDNDPLSFPVGTVANLSSIKAFDPTLIFHGYLLGLVFWVGDNETARPSALGGEETAPALIVVLIIFENDIIPAN
jgi:hypothetical protein